MTPDQRELLGDLLKTISRIERKSQPLLADPSLLDSEEGQDALDVICMQFETQAPPSRSGASPKPLRRSSCASTETVKTAWQHSPAQGRSSSR
jgi:hypothetical protein